MRSRLDGALVGRYGARKSECFSENVRCGRGGGVNFNNAQRYGEGFDIRVVGQILLELAGVQREVGLR